MGRMHPVEIASHIPQEGMTSIRLFGGPWDGKDVWVRDSGAKQILVNGPRHGDHAVWITHLYEQQGGRHEFVETEATPLSASRSYQRFGPKP